MSRAVLCCGHNMSLLLFDQEIKSLPDFQKTANSVINLVLPIHSDVNCSIIIYVHLAFLSLLSLFQKE